MEDSSNAIIENNDINTEQSESLDAEKKSENEKGCGQEVDLELEELLDCENYIYVKHSNNSSCRINVALYVKLI